MCTLCVWEEYTICVCVCGLGIKVKKNGLANVEHWDTSKCKSWVPAAQHYFQIFLWVWPGSVQQSRRHWCSPWCPPPHQPSARVGSGLKREKVWLDAVYRREHTRSSATLRCIKLLTKEWNSRGISCYLCRGSKRGRVHPDLLWWSRHAQTGWHWDPRTHGQNTTPPSDREEHRTVTQHSKCWL